MTKSRKSGKVPPANQSPVGPQQPEEQATPDVPHGAPASEKDPKGRLGNYQTAGEHAIVQPGGKQGSNK